MNPMAGLYMFLLGLAGGVTLLTLSSFRRVSPPWLRWLLIATGLLVIGRYVAMACFATATSPEAVWGLRRLWFATSLALPLQSAVAVDQLLRHPAMTPKKLLVWLSPWLLVYSAVILAGPTIPVADRVIGFSLRLAPGWQRLLAVAHGLFVAGFVAACLLFVRKVPARPIRVALLGLVAAQLCLALDGLLVASGAWYFRPYLYSELLMLAALWHAYETASALQHGGA